MEKVKQELVGKVVSASNNKTITIEFKFEDIIAPAEIPRKTAIKDWTRAAFSDDIGLIKSSQTQ